MKVYGYCRVSTAEQANAGLSLDSQQQQITGYCRMKGWPVAAFFVEAGVSGFRCRSLSVLKASGCWRRCRLATSSFTARLDRAFRSAVDALGTLEQLKEDKIGLHMIDLGGDVTGNGISKLVFTILSAVAENARDQIRERVREAKRYRVTQRLYNGGKRPFGFDVVEGRLVANANEQAALKHGLGMQKNGDSLRTIAFVWMSEYGLGSFDAKTVQRILERYRADVETVSA